MSGDAESLRIPVGSHEVEALLLVPQGAQWLHVLGHGAGAGMRHRFMADIATRLAERGVATLRYEYPYMTAGSKRPDPAPRLEAVTRGVVGFAAERWPQLRIGAGGKSMGGRMTSRAQAAEPLPCVEGLVFLGFPLHAAGSPGTDRAEHLRDVHVPMLFLQGTRDTLADLDLMRSVCTGLGERATLHVIEGADHGFAVLKRSGRTGDDVMEEMVAITAEWLSGLPRR
jgi:uncharacterized protein